jgi:1-pyrroline-5-carboxylate dehydrogenase
MVLPPFVNEPYTDFSKPEAQAAATAALAKVRAELGRDYDLIIAGERVKTADKMTSTNPSNVSELIGTFSKTSAELAVRAIESAHEYFGEWSQTTPEYRAELVLKAAAIIRERKMEFNAWLVLEAGKTWPEAEPEVAEAVDFLEYYARLMLKLAKPDPLVQLPGEKGELVYLPLGAGIIIPPWNFPLAILAGMACAALVAGNTVLIKPSSETPAIAAKFVEVLIEAGFPMKAFSFVPGSGSVIGDLLVEHPKTRFISFTGSRDVGLRINELAAKPRKGQIWIKRVVAEMGGKDAIVVDSETNLDDAVDGVFRSAFGYQGQKCSACSRAIVDAVHYDAFLDKLVAKVQGITQGPSHEFGNYMGAVVSASAKKSILEYIEIGRQEGRVLIGGGEAPGNGHYIQPTVIADIEPKDRVFQEEIFGPVLTVTKSANFDEGIAMANDSEYGLTGAVYTDNPEKIEKAKRDFFVGNLYINRKCTGAMVGAHPFGGFNMSGTDSKAGGPDYLLQFLQPKSIAQKIA